LAGGTDLLTLMKADVASPERLVDVKQLPELTARIADLPEGLVMEALTTLAEIETSSVVQGRYTALAQAAGLAATPQLRNMATIGGNLLQRPRCWYFRSPHYQCWLKGSDACPAKDGENQQHAIFGDGPCYAVHPSDPAVALLALDAEVQLRGRGGERMVALADFFTSPTNEHRTETVMERDEILLFIRVPRLPDGITSVYLKAMDRKVWEFALVSVAVAMRLDGGAIADARVVLGGVANVPWRAHAAEHLLVGAQANEETFTNAADAAMASAQSLAKNGYKVPLAKGLIRRALAHAAGVA